MHTTVTREPSAAKLAPKTAAPLVLNKELPKPLAKELSKLIELAMTDKKIMEAVVAGVVNLLSHVENDVIAPAENTQAAKEASIRARNVAALARLEDQSFEKLRALDNLLSTDQVQTFLNVGTRQAVSKRLKTNSLLGYKYKSNYYYPSFQFDENGVRNEVTLLWRMVMRPIEEERLEKQMNGFIRFLAGQDNYGGELRHRYEMLNEDSVSSFRQEYLKRNSMGR